MPDGPPQRLVRDLGYPLAAKLATERGTGRRCRIYRRFLRLTIGMACPPRVALVGVGDGIEVIAALDGMRATEPGPGGMQRSLYILLRHERECAVVERCQSHHKTKGTVRMACLPFAREAQLLLARGDFWFDSIVVAPTTSVHWTLEALRTLRPLCRSGRSTIILCRVHDPASRKILAALAEHGWGGIVRQELALLQRHGGPPPPRHAGKPEE